MIKAVARLYQSFQPEHYRLSWRLDNTSGTAHGHVEITGKKVGRPSQRFTLHGNSLKVESAMIIRHSKKDEQQPVMVKRINLQKSQDEIRLHTDEMLYPGTYTLDITFTAPIQDSMHGIYRSRYKLEGDSSEKVLLSTQFESHHAREAFPCIDEPEAKATFDLCLETAPGLTVVANMPATKSQDKDGWLHTDFERSPRMSTYLLAFAVGELQSRTTETKDGVKVAVYSTTAHRPEALDYALDTTKRCIEFFNDYYGVPYPLPKCDMVAIPDFSAAAMENWGLVTYREPFLLADPDVVSHSSRELTALVICHELSHQWFGDLVTMKWWNDLWLNESFANVMEYVAVDALFPEWHTFNTFVAQEGLAAFRRDSIAGVQAIKTEIRHPDEINSIFDPSIVYAKGGRLLNMLRTYIGEEAFRAGLTLYFKKHQYGNTTGDDLWAALSEASHQDVAAFMNPWLDQTGYPLLTIDQADNRLTVSQSHFLLDPSKADPNRRWPVPLLATEPSIPALLTDQQLAVSLPNKDFVRLDQDAVGHYVVHYTNEQHRQWLAEQITNQSLHEVERLIVLSDSTMLARSGVISIADTLQLLEAYRSEASEPVWDIIALALADTRRFIDSDPQLEDRIKALIRELIEDQYHRLGWQPAANETSADTKLRGTILGLGSYSEHAKIKAEALDFFEQYKRNDRAVDPELRGLIFATAVRYAAPGAFEYLLELDETTANPDLKQELLSSLSMTRDPARGTELLGRLKDTKKVRPHDIDNWLVLMLRNRYLQSLAWDWLRDNWQWIAELFAGDKGYDVFPRYAASAFNTRQRFDEYRAFFEPKADQIALKRNIEMGIEEITNRVSWIERDLPAVKQYFAKR